jgi:HK97 family phage major capsid protein
MLADTAQLKEIANTPADFSKFIKNYVAAQQEKNGETFAAQIKEQTQIAIAELVKDGKFGNSNTKQINLDFSSPTSARPSPALNNPHAKGAPLNGLYPDVYSFFQDVFHAQRGNLPAESAERFAKVKNYSEKVPSEGGFLVPEEFRSQLLQLAMETAVVRPRATVIPMSNPRLHIPSVDETSRVSSVFGGVIVYRTEEGAELTESSAAFASIKLDVTKQTALAHVPNELVRDWGAFGAFIDATIPAAMSFFEDIDFLSGNGVGQPLGALSTANTAPITVSAASGQLANTIVWENIIAMYARMLPSSLNSAVWIASPDTFAQLATMALTVGTGGSAIWLTNGVGAPTLTLLGRPVIMTEKAPAALGTVGDLSFVDFGMYLIGDYQTVTIDSSPHVKFTSDKTSFRAIARNDGRPWLNSPLTPHNNSATLSPFVQLGARP